MIAASHTCRWGAARRPGGRCAECRHECAAIGDGPASYLLTDRNLDRARAALAGDHEYWIAATFSVSRSFGSLTRAGRWSRSSFTVSSTMSYCSLGRRHQPTGQGQRPHRRILLEAGNVNPLSGSRLPLQIPARTVRPFEAKKRSGPILADQLELRVITGHPSVRSIIRQPNSATGSPEVALHSAGATGTSLQGRARPLADFVQSSIWPLPHAPLARTLPLGRVDVHALMSWA